MIEEEIDRLVEELVIKFREQFEEIQRDGMKIYDLREMSDK